MFTFAGSPRDPKRTGGSIWSARWYPVCILEEARCILKEAWRKKLFCSSAFWSMQRPYFGWRVRVTHPGCAVGGVAQGPGRLWRGLASGGAHVRQGS